MRAFPPIVPCSQQLPNPCPVPNHFSRKDPPRVGTAHSRMHVAHGHRIRNTFRREKTLSTREQLGSATLAFAAFLFVVRCRPAHQARTPARLGGFVVLGGKHVVHGHRHDDPTRLSGAAAVHRSRPARNHRGRRQLQTRFFHCRRTRRRVVLICARWRAEARRGQPEELPAELKDPLRREASLCGVCCCRPSPLDGLSIFGSAGASHPPIAHLAGTGTQHRHGARTRAQCWALHKVWCGEEWVFTGRAATRVATPAAQRPALPLWAKAGRLVTPQRISCGTHPLILAHSYNARMHAYA